MEQASIVSDSAKSGITNCELRIDPAIYKLLRDPQRSRLKEDQGEHRTKLAKVREYSWADCFSTMGESQSCSGGCYHPHEDMGRNNCILGVKQQQREENVKKGWNWRKVVRSRHI